jgi:hypothetical protein
MLYSDCVYKKAALALLCCLAATSCGGGGGGGGGAAQLCVSTAAGQALSGKLPGNGPYSIGNLAPAKGNVTIDAAGNFTYTPFTGLPSGDGQARGMDRFSYRAGSAESVVTVLIGGAVRIMPLGDSITAGVSGALSQSQQVGYRRKLFNDLQALSSGYGIDFVGSRNAEGSATTLPDRDHEGHPGWCDDNNPNCFISGSQMPTLDDNITAILNNNPPDIVLLHIGTNQFSTDSSGVNSILNKISDWAQSNYPVNVFIARIIPAVDGTLAVTTYNNNVQAIAGSRPGLQIFMVDQQSALRLASDANRADPVFMVDNLHPNQSGYDRMAARWHSDLAARAVLPVCR